MARLLLLVGLRLLATTNLGLTLALLRDAGSPRKEWRPKRPKLAKDFDWNKALGKASEELQHLNASNLSDNRAAIFSLAVVTNKKEEDQYTNQAIWMKCSAARFGSQLPYHLIVGGDRESVQRISPVLQSFGWNIEDRTNFTSFMKGIWRKGSGADGVHDLDKAKKMAGRVGKEFVDHHVNPKALLFSRKDGWKHYHKFVAWRETNFNRVLFADTDICFVENPDPILLAIPEANATFLANEETSNSAPSWKKINGAMPKHRYGINNHLMVFKPDMKVYEELVDRAANGRFVPYTNSDQDVIEAIFDEYTQTVRDVRQLFAHDHGKLKGQTCTVEQLETVAGDCEQYWKLCHTTNSHPNCKLPVR